ncbi:MAG: LVIVD repeat-containing protein, partial [Candidatus Helarchaeota archaeon]
MKTKRSIQLLCLFLLISFLALMIPTPNDRTEIAKNSNILLKTTTPIIGSYASPTSSINDIEIAGDTLYVTDRDGGLRVLDISDPTDPKEIGSYNETNDDDIMKLAIAGDILYMTNFTHLFSLNVSDPTNPTRVGITNPSGVNLRDPVIVGDVLYLPKFTNG